LTKGLSAPDILAVSKLAGTYTIKSKSKDGEPQERPLLPPDELKRHCRQQKFWAYLEGVEWTRSGRPIFAELVPIRASGWNWRASAEEYDSELARVETAKEWPSPFKMVKQGKEWVPVHPEAARRFGLEAHEADPMPPLLPLDTDAPPATDTEEVEALAEFGI
jgi:hypothetical protein